MQALKDRAAARGQVHTCLPHRPEPQGLGLRSHSRSVIVFRREGTEWGRLVSQSLGKGFRKASVVSTASPRSNLGPCLFLPLCVSLTSGGSFAGLWGPVWPLGSSGAPALRRGLCPSLFSLWTRQRLGWRPAHTFLALTA